MYCTSINIVLPHYEVNTTCNSVMFSLTRSRMLVINSLESC